MQHNPHVVKLAQDPRIRLHPSEGEKRGIQEGAKVMLKANGNAVIAKARLDKTVAQGTIVIPLGFEALPVQELGPNLMNGLEIEIAQATEAALGERFRAPY
jgi:NADH-quinone oxidoreductase subunit G